LIKQLKYVFIFFTFLLLKNTFSQCFDTTKFYLPGEKLTYEVAYNWGFIWVDAGEVYFKVDTTTEQKQACYFFDSYGESYRFYDWVFKVRDRFQSVATQKTLQPVWFLRNTYEGGSTVNNRYEYFPEEGHINTQIQHNEKTVRYDALPYKDCSFDVLSAIYYARSLEIGDHEIGEKIPISFIVDGAYYDLYIRYLGTENKKNRDGKVYDCLKFSAMLVEGTIFEEGENLLVWVTNDVNKVPVMVEAKILIGSIKAYLTGWENLRSPLKAIEDPY